MGDRLFPALLKYWRHRRGLSQLDLALAADISSRHLSFLETARAQPSRDMVLRLLATLDVPLREQNEVLEAAGFAAHFAAPTLAEVPLAVEQALARMMAQQEPYPLTVLSPDYDILRANGAAERVFARLIADPSALTTPINLLSLVFDPRLARPYVEGWPQVARRIVARLHREHLRRPSGALARVLAYPDVPEAWRQPDFSERVEPTLEVRFERDGWAVAFLTTITVFSAPQQVTLEELRVESYFPADAVTAERCAALAGSA